MATTRNPFDLPMTQRDPHELRRTLAQRQQQKAELELQVRSLHNEYRTHVAPLQEEVLRLQMERLKKAAQVHRRSARLRNAYHDAQEAYNRFQDGQWADLEPIGPAEDSLKSVYRRASKQCHPDTVSDTYEDEAAATFQALESAYQSDQERAVRAIAEGLERWGFPQRPSSASPAAGSAERGELKKAVSALDASIEKLQTSNVYEPVSDLDEEEIAAVVGARKRKLEQQLHALRRGLRRGA